MTAITTPTGTPHDSTPVTRADIANTLLADGVVRDRRQAEQLISTYLRAVSDRVGFSVHQWGLDTDDLHNVRATAHANTTRAVDGGDPIARARHAIDGLTQLDTDHHTDDDVPFGHHASHLDDVDHADQDGDAHV